MVVVCAVKCFSLKEWTPRLFLESFKFHTQICGDNCRNQRSCKLRPRLMREISTNEIPILHFIVFNEHLNDAEHV